MNKKMIVKLVIDLVMTILMVLAMAYHFTGNLLHEIIGVVAFILFLIHNFLNRRWHQTILKGRYNLHRALNTTTNLFLVVIMAVIAISGILLSRDVFTFYSLRDDLLVRRIHTAAANWGYLLIGLHLGMHWSMILGGLRNMMGITGAGKLHTAILRILAVAIVVWGVKASFERDIGLQLISYYTFSFWDPSQSAIGYLLGFTCIMGLYSFIAYYLFKLIKPQQEGEQP